MHQEISIDDIGRSHPIGKPKNGKISIIVRFVSYRKRQMVYSNKRKLKGNPHKTFITENLTKKRLEIIKRLAELKSNNKIHTFWTHDGTILVKRTMSSNIVKVYSETDLVSFN